MVQRRELEKLFLNTFFSTCRNASFYGRLSFYCTFNRFWHKNVIFCFSFANDFRFNLMMTENMTQACDYFIFSSFGHFFSANIFDACVSMRKKCYANINYRVSYLSIFFFKMFKLHFL